ncbi:hypothetical protein MMC18_003504 [Xylographa bjoerkii]|nr:hypothetical protein [Xylographa bjoerkii]
MEKSKELGIRATVERYKLAYSAFGDLNGLIDTLSAMNSALQSITPLLPRSTPPINSGVIFERLERTTTAVTPEHSSGDHGLGTGQSVGSPNLKLPQCVAARESAESLAIVNRPESNTCDDIRSLCRTLYTSTLQSVKEIANIVGDEGLCRAAQRLQIWGSGTFDEPFPLDQVLASSVGDYGLLRECLIKAFVSILVILEQKYITCSMKTEGRQQKLYKNESEKITILLGADETIGVALEYWRSHVDRHTEAGYGAQDQQRMTIRTVPRIVESIFDLLPAMMAARQICCLRAEELRNAKASKQDNSRTLHLTDTSFEEQCDTLNDALLRRDSDAKKQGKRVKIISPVFQKDRERRAELYESYMNSKGQGGPEAQAMHQKQQEMCDALANFILDMKLSSGKEHERISACASSSKQREAGQLDLPLEGQEADRVEAFIDFFQNETNSLWNILH